MLFTCRAMFLKRIMEACKDILGMIWFRFDKDEISFFNVDPEHVVSVRLKIVNLTEPGYSCEEDLGYTFCQYAHTLYKILRYVTKKDVISITTAMTSDLKLTVRDEDNDITKQRVEISSLNEPMPRYQLQHQEYSCEVSCKTAELYKILHHLAMMGNEMMVSVVNNTIIWEAQDGTGIKAGHFMKFDNPLSKEGVIQGTYYIKYAEKFLKAMVSEDITVSMAHNQPMRFVYTMTEPVSTLELKIARLE